MALRKDLTGQTFNKLKVLKVLGKTKQRHIVYMCLCECGKNVCVTSTKLIEGQKSCGCAYESIRGKVSLTHGMSRTPTYKTWCDMIQRTTNPNNSHYKNWGGRGIKICDRWLKFENFLEDMGEKPKGMTLDRVNNDGNYEPSNCRWITNKEQCYNRRSNRILTFKDRAMTLTQWAERTNISQDTIAARLKRGWSVEKALTEPVRKVKGRNC